MVTSDLHGAIRPIHYNTNAYRPAGLALLASLIRREHHEVHPFINVLNELGYDAAVMGNHEFNYGQNLLRKAVEDSHFPWLYHGGFESDLETGEPAERLTGENQAYAICRDIEGIDVLLTGHQHRQLTADIHGVTVIQPGFSGNGMAHVSVQLEQLANGKWQIAGKQARLLLLDENSDVQPDAAVMKLTDELEAKAQAWLDQPIGEVAGDLSIANPAALRLAAHPFIAFVHQVQMEATGAQISNTALLSEEARGFGSLITVRDVLSNFIYPNTLTVLELRGQDIRDALEQTARYFEVEASGEVIVNPAYMQPKPQHYNYDMWAGIEYELDISKPVGSRVVKLEREGIPVAMDATYSVVMNSYRAAGGGDYAMYPGKKVLHEGATDMAALVEDYIRRHQPLTVEQANNWQVVG
ncbi:hypothetical protein G195_002032 [Phytophthora kernoviae 00238/432]|uniref:5'-Nucleotidase C-terminal domain-containing protein n=1 Tax=Phytophthora kernoviae 00238/432 TaxID=1284355 RepID=A0A8J4SFX6_9STRA|nr:hypothetical protein G195_002032 [Phytophthora kernoviae 00238/432]